MVRAHSAAADVGRVTAAGQLGGQLGGCGVAVRVAQQDPAARLALGQGRGRRLPGELEGPACELRRDDATGERALGRAELDGSQAGERAAVVGVAGDLADGALQVAGRAAQGDVQPRGRLARGED